jgi:hypothetical protein
MKETLTKAKLRGQNSILKEWNKVLTKESKQQKIEICMLRKEVCKMEKYQELYQQRLNKEQRFNKLPWWRKLFYKFKV